MTDDGMAPSKVQIPEQPAELGPGFLSSYWNAPEPLPRMSRWETVQHFLYRGFENVLAIPLSSGITVGTIAVALFLLGGFLLFLQNIDRSLSVSAAGHEVIAYFRDGLEEARHDELLQNLSNDKRVEAVRYVSKDDALLEFQKELEASAELLEGLVSSNPLPASLQLRVRKDSNDRAEIDALVNELRNNSLIAEVAFASEWVEQSQRLLRVFRLFGLAALGVVLFIVVFLISNTIKLVVYMRRQEIGIMLLVGAADDAIRIPFMLGGLIQGVVGSILGLGFLRLAFLAVTSQLQSSPVLATALPEVFFLSRQSVIAVLFVGAGVGCLGSLFALRKFMKV